jgi:hypothetical protein
MRTLFFAVDCPHTPTPEGERDGDLNENPAPDRDGFLRFLQLLASDSAFSAICEFSNLYDCRIFGSSLGSPV